MKKNPTLQSDLKKTAKPAVRTAETADKAPVPSPIKYLDEQSGRVKNDIRIVATVVIMSAMSAMGCGEAFTSGGPGTDAGVNGGGGTGGQAGALVGGGAAGGLDGGGGTGGQAGGGTGGGPEGGYGGGGTGGGNACDPLTPNSIYIPDQGKCFKMAQYENNGAVTVQAGTTPDNVPCQETPACQINLTQPQTFSFFAVKNENGGVLSFTNIAQYSGFYFLCVSDFIEPVTQVQMHDTSFCGLCARNRFQSRKQCGYSNDCLRNAMDCLKG